MLLISSIILLIILFARIFEELFKVPYTLTIIAAAYSLNALYPDLFSVLSANFDNIIFLMLPLILLPDLFNLSIKEIRRHLWDFSYLTLFSAVATVAIGVWLSNWLLPEFQFTFIMLGSLYVILMATDAATISSTFDRFTLPDKLKIYAKGESLFNNILALILFFFIVKPILIGSDIHLLQFNQHTFEVITFSLLTGLVVAFFGYLGLKIIKQPIEQFIILYLVSIISFVVAEYWEIIGIFSLITAITMFKFFWELENKRLHKSIRNSDFQDVAQCRNSYSSMVTNLIQHLPSVSKRGIRDYGKETYYVSVFANTIVFICIADLVPVSTLLKYSREIIIVFLLTSLIRYFFIQAFVFSHKFQKCWGNVLTLAGMKGGLTIIMVHSLPESFVYKSMFEAIIVGVVILSTFIYSLLSVFYLQIYHCQFESDINPDNQHKTTKNIVKTLQDIVAKDPISKAYSRLMFEELLEKEINRAQRHKLVLSLIYFELDLEKYSKENIQKINSLLGNAVYEEIRDYDVFGKLSDTKFAIVCFNTGEDEAFLMAQRIVNNTYKQEGIAEKQKQLKIKRQILSATDDFDTILRKAKERTR